MSEGRRAGKLYRFALCAGGVASALAFAAVSFLPASDFIVAAAALLSASVAVVAVRDIPERCAAVRCAWRWIAAGLATAAAAELLYAICERVLRIDPFPSPIDALYIVSYPLLIYGATRFPSQRLDRSQRLCATLDCSAGFLATALAMIFVLSRSPGGVDASGQPLVFALNLLYPILDLALLYAFFDVLIRRVCPASPNPILWLIGGTLFWAGADFCYGTLADGGRAFALLTNPLYTLGWAAFATATARQADECRRHVAGLGDSARVLRVIQTASPYVPYIWVLLSLGVVAAWGMGDPSADRLLTADIGAGTVVALVIARQFVTIRINQRLSDSLRESGATLERTVLERTRALEQANRELRGEMALRARAEAERVAMERRMQDARHMESLGVLAAGVAHDFNNILVGILGNAELAIMRHDNTALTVKRLEDIRSAALRAAKLTRQLLDCAGKSDFHAGPLCPDSELAAVVADAARDAPAHIAVRWEPGAAGAFVEIDPGEVRRVTETLIANAVEAIGTESRGTVTVRTSRETVLDGDRIARPDSIPLPPGRYVRIDVADTGCGMTPAVLDRLFEPFFTTKFLGRGLGLPAARGIVRHRKGGLFVTSEPGAGTTMSVLLPEFVPASASGHPAPALSAADSTSPDGTGGPR